MAQYKHTEWKGDEFNSGDAAMVDQGENSAAPCTVKSWSPAYGGWWYIQYKNSGGMHYTRRLIKKDGIQGTKD